MTALAFIILSLLLAFAWVRGWYWKALHREVVKRWMATQMENEALQVQLNGARAGQQFVKKYCDEWADIIE